ncbi:MAG: hypothetical protein IPG89_14470 [Bacteroidetes bacterium]|nr:hypothetical protein [Bacteroidota bacterium]
MKKVLLLIALLQTFFAVSQTKTPIALPVIREADVMWAKDIWRIVDLNERQNFPFYFPIEKRPNQLNLFNVLLAGIDSNKITAYKSDDLIWNDTLTKKQVFNKVVLSDLLFIKRKFVSVIKKESNMYDREIEEYVNNVKEFLQESERIK